MRPIEVIPKRYGTCAPIHKEKSQFHNHTLGPAAEDPHLPDQESRCALHAELFLRANSGDDVWDRKEYDALGCAEFDPWSLRAR